AAASADGTVVLWDLDRRKQAATLPGHKKPVMAVAWSPDGRRLASASRDGTVVVWDLDNRRSLAVLLAGHGTAVCGVAGSAGGNRRRRLAPGGRAPGQGGLGREGDPLGRGPWRAAGPAGRAQGRGHRRRLEPGRQAPGLDEPGLDGDPLGRGERQAAGLARGS